MNQMYSFITIFDILGTIQGLILGVILLGFHKRGKNPTLFLALYIITYSFELISNVVVDVNICPYYILPLDFWWLQIPLLHIYVQKISVYSVFKTNYKFLIPGIVIFLIDSIIFLQGPIISEEISSTFLYGIVKFASLPYCLWIIYLSIKLLNNHQQIVENQFSDLSFKRLLWLKKYLYLLFLYEIVFFLLEIASIFDLLEWIHVYISFINIVMLYYVSLNGILQQNVLPIVDIISKKEGIDNASFDHFEILVEEKVNNHSVINNDFDFIVDALLNLLIEEEIYTKPDLTIIDISERLGQHPKKISMLINQKFNQNFNSYINGYRIEKAKKMLLDKKYNHFTIDGVGGEVGFKSKSVFYEAFKKNTGLTPLKFKMEMTKSLDS